MAVLEQFRVIFRSSKRHFQQVQAVTGVSGAQLWALAVLARQPGIRVTELARALAVHQSTASNLIEKLVGLHLIARIRSSEDARIVQLSLTKAGRQALARAPQPLEGVLPNALARLAPAELAELHRLLDTLSRHMKVRDLAAKRIPLADM